MVWCMAFTRRQNQQPFLMKRYRDPNRPLQPFVLDDARLFDMRGKHLDLCRNICMVSHMMTVSRMVASIGPATSNSCRAAASRFLILTPKRQWLYTHSLPSLISCYSGYCAQQGADILAILMQVVLNGCKLRHRRLEYGHVEFDGVDAVILRPESFLPVYRTVSSVRQSVSYY